MMKKISKKMLSLMAIAAIFSGFLIWFAFVYQLKEVKKASDDIQKAQLDASVQQERKQKILELGKELGNVELEQEAMGAMLIDKNDAVPFFKKLEDIAAETNNRIVISVVDFAKMKPLLAKAAVPVQEDDDEDVVKDAPKKAKESASSSADKEKNDYSGQIGFSILVSGRYNSLVDFLTKLENIPYFIKIYNLQIASDERKIMSSAIGSDQSTAPGSTTQEEDSNTIKSVLTIGVYTNESK
jgi:hypothetical protein